MGNPVTLADLRTRALDYADMDNTAFATSARVTDYLNMGLSELHYALANADSDYDFASATVTLDSAQESYPLPGLFYKLHKAYWSQDANVGTSRYRIFQFGRDSIDGWRTSPVTSGVVLLHFHPLYQPLIHGAHDSLAIDTVLPTLPPGWEDYAALHAAVRLRAREQDSAQELRAERDRCFAQIMQYAAPRNNGDVDTISDVGGRWEGWPSRTIGEPMRGLRYRIQGARIFFVELTAEV